ncbi:MAG TPA: oxygenase MpaB family protein, partial [Acidimicrobiales bacterium]
MPEISLRSVTAPVVTPVTTLGDAVGSAVGSTIESAVGVVRGQLGRGVRRMVAGDRPPVRDLSAPVEGDPGLFGPESVTWRIHSDASMFVGGLRALLLQMLHPLAMAGVADHSDYRHHPDHRLARTALYVATTTYGTTAQAEQAIATVKRVHEAVVGTAPDGRAYAASDPHLVAWVHHAEVDSFLRAYERYGTEPLTAEDADRYVAEMAVLCELLGGEPPARSVAELRSYFRSVRPELRAGSQAREAARWLMVPPLPLAARPAYAVIAPAAVGLLPGWAQRELWLPLLPGVDPVVV